MKLRKLLMVTMAVCALAVSATGFAAAKTTAPSVAMSIKSTLTAKNAAIAAAKQEVPADCNYYGTKSEDGFYAVKYQSPSDLAYYNVLVNKETAKIDHITISGSRFPGSVTINKTVADVKAIILATYPDATDIVIDKKVDTDKILTIYEATFKTPKFTGMAKLNPATGAYGYRELNYKK